MRTARFRRSRRSALRNRVFALLLAPLSLPAVWMAESRQIPALDPSGLRPRIAPPLPQLEPGQPVLDPFARIALRPTPDRIAPVPILAPGEAMELPLPEGMDPGRARLRIESASTYEVWELPIESIRTVLQKPSLYAPQRVRVPVVVGQPGFTVPQLPAGVYRVFYLEGDRVGPKRSVRIKPVLVISGRRSRALDTPFELQVSLAGPALAPETVLVRSAGGRLPNGQRIGEGALLSVRRPPAVVQLPVTVVQWGRLAIESANTVRMDESGIARFRFTGRQIGTSPLIFTAPGVDRAVTAVRIERIRVPPIVEDPNRRLRIAVFGDSLAWGQGLKPENKYSGLVEAWMEGQTSRVTDTLTWAHSGGTVRVQDPTNGNRRLPGEVPVWFPAVPRQIEFAQDELDGKPVDVVLINGGINDVPVLNIINPFSDTKDLVVRTARGLKNPIRDALIQLGRTFEFRKSLIIYTGYFPLITGDSNVELMASSLFLFFSLIPSLEGRIVGFAAAAAIEALVALRHPALTEQSAAFHTTITDVIRNALAAANAELGPGRVIFADPGFSSRNAFCAPDTLLWTFGVEDEVAGQRQIDGAPYALEAPAYPVASMCHPNREGARRYAESIIRLMERPENRAIWDATRPRKVMRVETTQPAFVIPAGQDSKAFTFTVRARDASTGVPLSGDVYIDGHFAGRAGDPIQWPFRRPTTASPKPPILVSFPAYADAELAYSIR